MAAVCSADTGKEDKAGTNDQEEEGTRVELIPEGTEPRSSFGS